jgi:hypothetical protein
MDHLEAQRIADARLQHGQVAWNDLLRLGGPWPETEHVSLPPQMLDGMGEYSAEQVQPILSDALPTAPVARAWPWIAHAAFVYSTELKISASYGLPETNTDKLVERIGTQAGRLHSSLMALNSFGIRSPEEVGKPHADKAWSLLSDLQTHFGGPQSNGTEYARFTESLAFIEKACKARAEIAASSRKRGASDPHLSLLVWYLSDFWNRATGRAPSAADPVRKDGRPGPFVRLVNACQSLADQQHATMAAVSRALENPPEFARQKD